MKSYYKRYIGRYGTFKGYDDRYYNGKVTNVHKDIIEFTYDKTNQYGIVTLQDAKAYIEKSNSNRLILEV